MSTRGTSLGQRASVLEGCVSRAIDWLRAAQYRADGVAYYRGEFPMQLWGRITRPDHNFLTGYTLVHLALVRSLAALRPAWREAIEEMLELARDIPARYCSVDGMCNWYHGKLTGCGAPPDYDWKDGVVLCLCDDYDDTSIAAQLSCLAGTGWAGAELRDRLIASAAPARNAGLGYRSLKRLEITGVGAGVYTTWKQPPPDAEVVRRRSTFTLPLRMVPQENSVELVTAANIWTAISLLGGDSRARGSQQATARFVNRLAQHAVSRLLAGEPGDLRVAAPYYPWVPFAPLAFLLHDHCAAGNTLLDGPTREMIGEALVAAPPDSSFIAQAFWLNCAAWCSRAGCLPPGAHALVAARWDDIERHALPDGGWPDFVFFNEAHIGNYGGRPYTQALMLETALLLLDTVR